MKNLTIALAASIALLLPATVNAPPYVHTHAAHSNIDWD